MTGVAQTPSVEQTLRSSLNRCCTFVKKQRAVFLEVKQEEARGEQEKANMTEVRNTKGLNVDQDVAPPALVPRWREPSFRAEPSVRQRRRSRAAERAGRRVAAAPGGQPPRCSAPAEPTGACARRPATGRRARPSSTTRARGPISQTGMWTQTRQDLQEGLMIPSH